MIARPWEPGDVGKMRLQGAQDYLSKIVVPDDIDLSPLVPHGFAWTGEVDGEIIVVGGLEPVWNDRAIAFAFMFANAGPHFLTIHRAVKSFLDQAPFRRIEATIDVGFKAGARWMKMLGFELEGLMKAYRPDGADMLLYAKVKGWHSSHH